MAISALRERRLRSSLTIVMIMIGVSLMCSLNGINAGFSEFIDKQLSVLAPNVITVLPSSPLARVGQQGGGPLISSTRLTLTDYTVKTLSLIPGVKDIAPHYRGSVKLISSGKVISGSLIGIDPTKVLIINPGLKLLKGSLIDVNDHIGITLGYNLVHIPGEEQPFTDIGRTVIVEYSYVERKGDVEKVVVTRRSFVVRGILDQTGNTFTDYGALITLSAANSLMAKSHKYDGIYLVTRSIEMNDFVISKVREIYGENIGIISPAIIKQTIEDVLSGVRAFILAVASVSMIVGAVGIMTTLFTSVMERIREIGTLKALGCRNRDILLMFLSEALVMGIIGGVLGMGGGIVGSYLLLRLVGFGPISQNFVPIFLIQDLVSIWIIAIVVSIVAGLYPAWRASQLPPIVALRRE
ncbi:MAG: FtsX-like permease family protein [Nitrososphaerales archaeon]|nr:FtsX-like permease family protein [Nitrososphaerales archaeon]